MLQYQFTIGLVARLLDVTVISGIWFASFWLRFYVPLAAVTKGFPEFSAYAAVTPLIAFLWFLIFDAQDVYVPSPRQRRASESWRILRAHATALVVFVALSYVFSEYRFSRGMLLTFGLLTAVALIGGRLVLRTILSALRGRGYRSRPALLVGEPEPLATLIARFAEGPEMGIDLAGVLIPTGMAPDGVLSGVPVLGDFSMIAEAIESTGARQVVIALPRRRWFELESILSKIHDHTVDVQVVPDLHEYVTLGCEVETLDGLPIVRLNGSPLRGWGALFKRLTDVVLRRWPWCCCRRCSCWWQPPSRSRRAGPSSTLRSAWVWMAVGSACTSSDRCGWTPSRRRAPCGLRPAMTAAHRSARFCGRPAWTSCRNS